MLQTTCLNPPKNMALPKLATRLMSLFLIISSYLFGFANATKVVNIGAIIDVNSRGGKEEKTAMKIAVESFNNVSETHKLVLHFMNSGTSPLQAASAAEELIKGKKVKAILGMETWEETTIVAEVVSNQPQQIPVLSLAAPPTNLSIGWPFLIRMSHDMSEQIKCIAYLIRSYRWRRVVAIYEQEADSAALFPLSQALRDYAGAEIDLVLALPPFSSMPSPQEVVKQELEKALTSTQSRVFVVLRTSLSMSAHLFKQAKELGLMERDSVWIVTESITSFLDSVNYSFIASMHGTLGLKAYYNQETKPYQEFHRQFRVIFRSEYQEEDHTKPGIRAVRAYNSINVITQALEQKGYRDSTEELVKMIKLGKFVGLSGEAMRFGDGVVEQEEVLRVVNVVGKSYNELRFWVGNGFSERIDGLVTESVGGVVNWLGDSDRVPKGWEMPAKARLMKIGVPARTSFDKFVKVGRDSEVYRKLDYSGFCIELFKEVLEVLGYDLPYEFTPYNCTYDELVDLVSNKSCDAIVGDVTILAKRMERVEFTQPYLESGLSMIVAAKSNESAWIFLKPFSFKMWLVTAASLIYTVFIVWFLEHHSNPAFKDGGLKDQIGNALWFTFSSVFYAHRERIENNLTRVVVVAWLFLVMVLTSSYTAGLSSMLTVQKLGASGVTIESLKKSNARIGCDGDSFVKSYLVNVLGFRERNIIDVDSQDKYDGLFRNGTIRAAFLELPYEKVFINHYCQGYTATTPTYRFGGLAFVFQKGSPIAKDFSSAILKLSENGKLKELEEEWFRASAQCSTDNITDDNTESLKLHSFWALYAFSVATSTICFLFFVTMLLRKYRRRVAEEAALGNLSDPKVWNKVLGFANFLYAGEVTISSPVVRAPTFARSESADEWSSPSRLEHDSPGDSTPEHHHESSPQAQTHAGLS